MNEPTGYTALDLIGFTDRGNYNPVTNYVKNDLVHYGGSIWRILIDDTIGQTPQEGIYYTVFVKEPTNMVERIMAPLEQNPATQAWAVGRQIINNDYLYEVIAPIAIGDNLVAYEDDPTNANIKLAPPIETQVLAIKNEADKTEDMIAPAESNPAAASHSVGTQIIVDNILYDVTSPIAANDALVAYPTAGYNIKPAAPVSSQIQALTNNKADNSDIAIVEGNTFSKKYTAGQTFYHDGVYYEAKTTIPQGTAWSSLTLDAEYKIATPVASQISDLNSNVSSLITNESKLSNKFKNFQSINNYVNMVFTDFSGVTGVLITNFESVIFVTVAASAVSTTISTSGYRVNYLAGQSEQARIVIDGAVKENSGTTIRLKMHTGNSSAFLCNALLISGYAYFTE